MDKMTRKIWSTENKRDKWWCGS